MDERAFFNTLMTVANVTQNTWGGQRCEMHADDQPGRGVKQGKHTSMPNSGTTHPAVCLSTGQTAVFFLRAKKCGRRQ
jgi:hypothetical protein